MYEETEEAIDEATMARASDEMREESKPGRGKPRGPRSLRASAERCSWVVRRLRKCSVYNLRAISRVQLPYSFAKAPHFAGLGALAVHSPAFPHQIK